MELISETYMKIPGCRVNGKDPAAGVIMAEPAFQLTALMSGQGLTRSCEYRGKLFAYRNFIFVNYHNLIK